MKGIKNYDFEKTIKNNDYFTLDYVGYFSVSCVLFIQN